MSSAGRPGRKPFWSIRGMHLQFINVVELAEVSISRIQCCATRTESHRQLDWPEPGISAAASHVPVLYQVLCAVLAPCGFHCRAGHADIWETYYSVLICHLQVLQMADVSYGTRPGLAWLASGSFRGSHSFWPSNELDHGAAHRAYRDVLLLTFGLFVLIYPCAVAS